ncbi:rod shape-determining protein RodA [bacterium]|nr:rod shape-determining protein RodA [bacterium]
MHSTNLRVVKSRLNDLDYKLVISVLGLLLFGLALIYSADHSQGIKSHFTRQVYFALTGTVILIAVAAIPPRLYYAFAYIVYAIGILSLILVPLAGVMGFGAKRWLIIGGINVQPSEPAKLALILALSRFLAQRRSHVSIWKILGIAALFGLPPTVLVLLQPDMGTATVFPILTIAMLAWFGLPLKVYILFLMPLLSLFLSVNPWIIAPLLLIGLYILKRSKIRWYGIVMMITLCTLITFSAPVAWNQLEPYQQKRLTTFLNPAEDPLGSGYQVIQSKVAVGSGGLTGQGFLEGPQTQLRFLPEQHTDFIFALAGEELGFFGTSAIIVLFMLFVISGFIQASRTRNQFMSFVAVGVTTMFLYHTIINIGMVLGILPVTGLPLPLISYGGSFLLTCLTGTGILLSVGLYRREH